MLAEPPELRPARIADAAALARIAAASLPEAWSPGGFRAALEAPTGVGLVAVDRAGEPLGFALGSCVAGELEIATVAVEPSRRRRGLGRALVGELLARGRAGGARRASLEVRATNAAARALYAGLGFRTLGERARYYRDGEGATLLGRAL